MKVTIDIDCTPEEARRFFGLPDVTGLHEAMAARMQERLKSGWTAEDTDAVMKQWLAGAAGGMEAMRQMFDLAGGTDRDKDD